MELQLNLTDKGAINYALQLLREDIKSGKNIDTLITPDFIEGLILKVWSIK